MNATELVRLASGRYTSKQSALPPQLTDLMRRIVRAPHILLTLKRDQLIREGRAGELDELVRSTRNFWESLLEGTGRTAATDSETGPS